MKAEEILKQLEEIAKEELFIETLTTQNSDSKDFHEVAVWSVKEALKKAYALGQKNAK